MDKTNISKNTLFNRVKNKIIPYALSLSILTGTNFIGLPLFAQEKTKTEKESKFKIPDWLDLYADVGYVYGNNYYLKSEQEAYIAIYGYDLSSNMDIKVKNIWDLSLGAGVLYNFKNIPIFFYVNVSNLYDGLRKNYSNATSTYSTNTTERIHIINWNSSYPYISCSIGLSKKYSGFIFNTAFSYARNIKSNSKSNFERDETELIDVESILKNHAFSASISKSYKNFTITLSSGFSKMNSEQHFKLTLEYYGLYNPRYKISEDIINMGLSLTYNYKYITPYLSFYHEFDNNPSIERSGQLFTGLNEYSNKKKGLILATGIHFSTLNISNWISGINRNIFHPNSIKELFIRTSPAVSWVQ